jgi:hypothetical protein
VWHWRFFVKIILIFADYAGGSAKELTGEKYNFHKKNLWLKSYY